MTVFGELSTLSPRPNRVRANSEQFRSFFDEDELVANGHLEPSEHAVSYISDLLKPYQYLPRQTITRDARTFGP